MDFFDKYDGMVGRRDKILAVGTNPFAVPIDRIVSATEAEIKGREVILVGTNNYLGLTFDPAVVDAAATAVRVEGTGTTGSRIANGSYAGHQALEQQLANFLGMRSAIVFSTGYQANLGVLAGLTGPKDIILIDADSHASIYDGCQLSGATVIRFRHNSPEDLDKRLHRLADQETNKLVVVEGIYSMLGDKAPLQEIAEVKRRHGAGLLVDEAHSLGVFGEKGQGLSWEVGVEDDVDFVVGTFSKSLGAIGGFGASNHPKFDMLRYTARPYMFTASPSPSSIATARASLQQIEAHPELRSSLWRNAQNLYDGLNALGLEICSPMSPIIAVRMPDEETAVRMWNALLDGGVYVNLALPPGTPDGGCLLRCSVSSAHTVDQIRKVCDVFAQTWRDVNKAKADAGKQEAAE